MDYNPLNKIKMYEFKEMKERKEGRKRETGREKERRALFKKQNINYHIWDGFWK